MIRVVQERTAQRRLPRRLHSGWFPRTPAQAEMLEQLAAEQGKEIQAIVIDVPLRVAGEAHDRPAQLSGLRRNLQHLFQAAEE